MGTICAPSFANAFMLELENKHVYPLIKYKPVIYLRYTDGIFMLLIKSESELRHFMNETNQKHPKKVYNFWSH